MNCLRTAFPWVKLPLVVSAPMLGAATPKLALNVSGAGGLGFLAGGTDPKALDTTFAQVKSLRKPHTGSLVANKDFLPVGVGFQLFNSSLSPLAEVIGRHCPAAVWLFAPEKTEDIRSWSRTIRDVTSRQSQIWIQVGSVAEAEKILSIAEPDVLVAQGSDAGGHGRARSGSIISLVPEVVDMLNRAKRPDIPVLAAGGIVEARGFAAALALGASGVVMGTRFLASEEAGVAAGWKNELIRCSDGGVATIRSTLCDRLKETKGWPAQYDGRAISNRGHVDEHAGMTDDQNIALYQQELQMGDGAWDQTQRRMVAYAGTGVGLIHQIKSAADIVREMLEGVEHIHSGISHRLDGD